MQRRKWHVCPEASIRSALPISCPLLLTSYCPLHSTCRADSMQGLSSRLRVWAKVSFQAEVIKVSKLTQLWSCNASSIKFNWHRSCGPDAQLHASGRRQTHQEQQSAGELLCPENEPCQPARAPMAEYCEGSESLLADAHALHCAC